MVLLIPSKVYLIHHEGKNKAFVAIIVIIFTVVHGR